jgi:hypothetical protein
MKMPAVNGQGVNHGIIGQSWTKSIFVERAGISIPGALPAPVSHRALYKKLNTANSNLEFG